MKFLAALLGSWCFSTLGLAYAFEARPLTKMQKKFKKIKKNLKKESKSLFSIYLNSSMNLFGNICLD